MDLGFLGGFCSLGRAYSELPFEIVWANDINEAACATYQRNLSPEIICGDITGLIEETPDTADVVIGGFPCQDISINGLRKGASGERSGLYRRMVEVVDRCQPQLFIAENVKGITQRYNRDSLRQVVADFEGIGYKVDYYLFLAADFGVPQMRERVFFIGTRPNNVTFAPPTPMTEAWLTCREAIGDLESLAEDPSINHIWSKAQASPEQGMRRLKADKPSDTIRAEHHGNIQFHYALSRRISMREAARLQSFPDDFVFSSGMRQIERQIGNAVPPVLSWHIASAALTYLKGIDAPKAAIPQLTDQLALAID
jgi:DNA (cytosine-5)-methyltransferase 1